MEKFLHREKGWFWKKKKKMIPHFLGQEMSSQLKVSLGKSVVHLHLVFALTFYSKRINLRGKESGVFQMILGPQV